jgi:trehalose-phosphatase
MSQAPAALDWLAAVPSRTALFTDFDGTLSRIVLRPELAEPLPGVPGILRRLAQHLRVVGVASGRPAAWLVEQLGLASAGEGASGAVVEAYGLHGVERAAGGGIEVAEAARAWLGAVASARDEAVAAAVPEMVVEDKTYSLTLHWRSAADPAAVSEQAGRLAARLSSRTGLLSRPGKASLELIAPIGIDKGTVVALWGAAAGVERMAFFGDDLSDVPAFAAVDELVASAGVAGLKVAVTGPEAPDELLERADLVLGAPEEAVRLLADLADRLEVP